MGDPLRPRVGVLPMKPHAVNDGALYEEGFFVFELDDWPERAFCVKADGVVVAMDPDRRYRLRRAPSAIEVELCAGPIYTPPLRWFLAKHALSDVNRRMLAAWCGMGGRAEPVEPGEIFELAPKGEP